MAKSPSNNPQNLTAPIRYCLYARKSMEAEERQAMSIDSQINEMKAIAEREHLNVAAIKTEAHSAKKSGTREVYLGMIKDIAAGTYNAILTWNPDRLSRNAGDLGLLVDLMDQGHLREIRTYGQAFSNSPNDKFLLMILGSQAKLENDNRGVNVKRGLRALVERGLYPGTAPLGYHNPTELDKLGHKKIDPERAPIVKQMFEKVAYEKYSSYDVLRWLYQIDFRSMNNKRIAASNVLEILHRPFYYGEFEYPRGSGKWYKGVHEPIITKKLYDATQAQIERYRHEKKRKSVPDTFAFIRLIRCGNCGSGITAEEKFKTLASGEPVVYRYYMCTHGRNRWCRDFYINEADLIKELLRIFDRLDVDLIGTKVQLEAEIEKWYRVEAFVTGQPVPERSPEQKEIDLRKWAKTIFEDGSTAERRAMLQNVKSRLILKNKKLYLDTDEIPKTPEPSDEANLAIRRGKNLRRRWKPTSE
jgi:site-specific DNA recombinase